MRVFLKSVLLAVMLAVSAMSGPAMAQDPETAPVMSWGQFSEQLDQRQLQRFTGVSGGYVAFVLCNGNWFRVRAATSDVIQALQERNYQPSCG